MIGTIRHVWNRLRQIFFHAKTDRMSTRRSRRMVRSPFKICRGLVLSDTFKRTFYGFNSNYKVVRYLRVILAARSTAGKLSWSIVITSRALRACGSPRQQRIPTPASTQFIRGTVCSLVASLGTPPSTSFTPLRRVLPEHSGFPQLIFTGGPAKTSRAAKSEGAALLRTTWLGQRNRQSSPSGSQHSADMDYLSKVPYRSVSRESKYSELKKAGAPRLFCVESGSKSGQERVRIH